MESTAAIAKYRLTRGGYRNYLLRIHGNVPAKPLMYASPYGVRCGPLREITPISMYSSMSSGTETMEVR